MKLTMITDENIGYFDPAVGERFRSRKENELFAGVIDDAGEAVAAAVFLEEEGSLILDLIGVALGRDDPAQSRGDRHNLVHTDTSAITGLVAGGASAGLVDGRLGIAADTQSQFILIV